jgi:flavodoxin
MRILVTYDSSFGNTETIAKIVAKVFKTNAVLTNSLRADNITGIDLLVVGSPTQGGKPTKAIQDFFKNLKSLKGVKVAVFDTRILAKDQKIGLRILMKTIGYAAEKMASEASKKGASVIAVEGFIVNDKEGPLRANEEKHANDWAKSLLAE